jgi:Flp pilus assembly protein TadD
VPFWGAFEELGMKNVIVTGIALAILSAGEPIAAQEEVDPLAEAGLTVTSGAAQGYVEDRACNICHDEIWESYQEVAMAQSFFRPAPEKSIETFDGTPVFHAALQRYYEMRYDDGSYLFRRYQLDEEGAETNLFEVEVDWILGSGKHSRTYLYQTEIGELYQLPLAWYTQTQSWAMAPGFELSQHFGIARQVRRECMFCHNAYPDVPFASDDFSRPHVFPPQLPSGIGCQRCHGPGAEHVRTAIGDDPTEERLKATIVNPARLSTRRSRDICYQCHMQPSVSLFGVRRFDRGDYSFRPGDALADYIVKMDIVDAKRPKKERFEINHHPYRLEQSRCFTASDGKLGCLTCHDPHRAVPASVRADHFRSACLSCHQEHGCARPEGAETPSAEAVHSDTSDCVGCHMPKRRTQDVVEVVMTDHLIRRHPGGPELLAPLEQQPPTIVDVVLLDPERAPGGLWPEVYRTVAVLRVVPTGAAVDILERLLDRVAPLRLTPSLELGGALLKVGRYGDARAILETTVKIWPGSAKAHDWLGVALARMGSTDEALASFSRALELAPDDPQAHFNMGRTLLTADRHEQALAHLQRATRLRPNLAVAWLYLGRTYEQLGRTVDAKRSFERVLAVEPAYGQAYIDLARLLHSLDQPEAARRYLRHGARVVPNPKAITEELNRLPVH